MKTNYFALPGLLGLKELRINSVKTIVLDTLGVNWEDLKGDCRLRPLPDSRKILAFFIKKYCGKITSVALGRLMNKDHATILYYLKTVDNLRTYDPVFRELMNKIELRINNHNYTIKNEDIKTTN